MSLQNQDIPTDWETVEIGQINEYQSSNINPSNYSEEIFELYSVPTFRTGFPEFLKGKDIGSTKQCVEPDDILLCKINPRINRVWRVNDKKKLKQIASSEWIIVRQKGLNSDYLKFYFRELNFRNKLCLDVSGVGGSLTRAQPKRVSKYHIPIPPLPEQKQIAARLDALLAQVDTLKTRLDTILTILKRYRQSVLAAAISGKLTEEWRGEIAPTHVNGIIEYCDAIKKDKRTLILSKKHFFESELIFNIPSSWEWVRLCRIAEVVSGVAVGGKKSGELVEFPYLRVANVQRGYLDLGEIKTISVPKAKAEKLFLKKGDILFNEGGDLDKLGRGWIWENQVKNCIHQNHVFRARLYSHDCEPRFLSYYGNSSGRDYFVGAGSQTINLANINKTSLSLLPVPLPPKEEQIEIVRRVDQLFAFADQIEQRVTEAKKRVDHLTQSILAKAFRGDLTADWRAQNPDLISGKNSAQALLEQIKRERDRLTKVGKTKSKNATRKKGNTMMPKQIIPIIEALTAAEKPLKAQELLSQAGYPNDAGTDQLEAFFLDIREKLKLGTISRVRQGEDDIFELVK